MTTPTQADELIAELERLTERAENADRGGTPRAIERRQELERFCTPQNMRALLRRLAALTVPPREPTRTPMGEMTDEEMRVLRTVTVRKPTVWERRAFCAGRDLAIECLPAYAEREIAAFRSPPAAEQDKK